jgi:hypothetical protein
MRRKDQHTRRSFLLTWEAEQATSGTCEAAASRLTANRCRSAEGTRAALKMGFKLRVTALTFDI